MRIQMRPYRQIISLLAFAVLSAAAYSQNLDPTVEVNRAYEGKLMEVHKPLFRMEVPDSVTRFDLDFDYSVFESPYRGSYEFNPYLLSMKPGGSSDRSRRFYMRAGAGYQLKPVLDLVWSPKMGKGFKMDVYALHRSFVGSYWNMASQEGADGVFTLDRKPKDASDRSWKGYDLMSRAGFDARHDWKKGVFSFGADYYGLAQKDREWNRTYNAVDAYMGLGNKGEWEQSFLYDFRIDYRYGGDRMTRTAGGELFREHVFSFDGSLGPVFRENHTVLFDFGIDMASYSRAFDADGGQVWFVPHYVFEKGPFMLDLGLRFSVLLPRKESFFESKGQVVYPDMKFHIALVPDAMRFYLHAGGGNRLNTYSSIIEDNRHLNIHSASRFAEPLLDYTVERVALAGGFEGRISSRFSYNLRAGYVNYGNDIADCVVIYEHGAPEAGIFYLSYQKWFAGLDWCFDVEGFRFDGSVIYNDVWGDRTGETAFLRPAAVVGEVAAEYNWKRRIFFGADCEFMTARRGKAYEYGTASAPSYLSEVCLPGFADLGVYAEYVTSRGLSFWLRGGNLLNMTIQRNPLYAEKGLNFTAGICLSL